MLVAAKARSKPKKPYPTFPLTPHPNGQWCKKVRGRIHFFGVWADPKAALQEYNRCAAFLHGGIAPPPKEANTPTVKLAFNAYLAAQKAKAERGIITARWFDDCVRALRDFSAFQCVHTPVERMTTKDFARYRLKLYDRLGVCAIDRHITIIRGAFKHAYETDLIDRPLKYGGQFNKPSAKERRQSRLQKDRENGKRLFEGKQIRQLLQNAKPQLKAMILLGVNGGFGNTDLAELPRAAVNLRKGIIEYERPKTAISRVVPLWPETTEALMIVLGAGRPAPLRSEYDNLVFLTRWGNPWTKARLRGESEGKASPVSHHQGITAEFDKLLRKLGMKRPGLGFYALRHTFRTWADEVKDPHAIHRVMGHAIPGMSGIYVEEIGLGRLKAVTDHVRRRVFNSL